MPLSEAKKAADKRYVDKLDNIMVRPYREEGTKIRAAAAVAGMSVQAYVLRAVRAWMEREQAASVTHEENERLPRTLEGEASKSYRDVDKAAGDWTARLSRAPNRSRTIEAIKRITETNDDKNNQ